jgi:RNA polymerase sigma-70 factor (ECF subfamily)
LTPFAGLHKLSATPSPMDERAGAAQITRLLHEWQDGSQDALERLVPLVYDELHTLASRQLAREWRHDRLQTTAVVNEAYLKLFGQREIDWQNRGHFFAIAAQLMRRILVDHARRQLRQKRGGGGVAVELDDALAAPGGPLDAVEALDLDRVLRRLEQLDPNQARIVEMRFFGGLTVEETAAALGVSPATIKREWAVAKGWLYRELTRDGIKERRADTEPGPP